MVSRNWMTHFCLVISCIGISKSCGNCLTCSITVSSLLLDLHSQVKYMLYYSDYIPVSLEVMLQLVLSVWDQTLHLEPGVSTIKTRYKHKQSYQEQNVSNTKQKSYLYCGRA